MATKMKMVMKGGKMVPAFAADGKGKMAMGGVKKMQKGGPVDGPMEARRKIMGEKKPSLKKTLRYVRKNGSGYIPSSTTKKMQDGGRVTGRDIRDAQRAAKLARINAGTEPSTYQKVSDIAGKVANVATTVGQGINAVKDIRGGNNDPNEQKRGGSIKLKKARYQNGGSTGAQLKAKGQAMKAKGAAMKEKGELMKSQGQNYRTYQANKALDSFFMGDAVRAKSAQINKAIDPTRNKINAKVSKVNDKLTPYVNKVNRAVHGPTKVAKSQMGGATKKYQMGGTTNTNTTLAQRLNTKIPKSGISSKQFASILKNGKSIPATKRKKI
jgi:hypothetical protein